MTGSSRLIVEYAGSWALVAAGARSERPGLLRSFHQRSREDRSWLLTPFRPSETRRGVPGQIRSPNLALAWARFASSPLARSASFRLDVRGCDHLAPQTSQFRRPRPKTAGDQRFARDRSPINRLSSRSSAGSPRQRGLIIAAVDALLLDQPAAVEFHAEIVIEAHGV